VTRTLSGSELEGQAFEEGGKPLERVTKPRGRGLFLGIKGMTGSPAMPVPRVQGLGFPRSVTSPFWKPPLAHALGGFSGQAGLAPRTLAFQCPTSVPLPHVK